MKTNNRHLRLFLFLSISLIWSLVWFTNKETVYQQIEEIPSLVFYATGWIPAIGILLASLIVRSMQINNEMTILGQKPFFSLIIFSIPILLLGIIGVGNKIGMQPNIFGLTIGLFTLLYALFEEFGWRGYLQEELQKQHSKWITYLIVGLIWYLWHWYFLRPGSHPNLFMIPILIGASAGIGEVGRVSKSIMICAALHGLVNILMIYGVIANELTMVQKLIILSVSLFVWIPLIRRMGKGSSPIKN